MKRLLSILGSVGVCGTAASTVVACQNNKIPIRTVIGVTDLGPIGYAGAFPTFAELIPAIQAKNPGSSALSADNIRLFGQPGATSARLQGIREYQDFVTVTYTKSGTTPVEKDISKIVTNTALGPIVMATPGQPTKEEILAGIKKANPSTASALTVNDFTLTNATGTSATITGTNGYTGSANLTYSRETNLNNIIKVVNLGEIANSNAPNGPSAADLLAGIKAANPGATGLTTSDFTINGTATATSANITGAGAYTGSVALTYTSQTDITKLITVTNLGPITMAGTTPTLAELLTAIKKVNPKAGSLTTTQISLSGAATTTNATIQGVSPFTGSVALTYTKATLAQEPFIFNVTLI